MSDQQTRELIESWHDNADAWTQAVRQQQIESRRLVTDAAIIDAIQLAHPAKVLDLGCGEGWLCRQLNQRGIQTTGIDVSLPLVEAARAAGGGEYFPCSYATFCDKPEAFGCFDVVVANFSILGDDLAEILKAAPKALNPDGRLIVQTLHPTIGDVEQADGWRVESFASFDGKFRRPMPWYFRTLSSWKKSFAEAGLHIDEIREPVHPKTGSPASILFIARPAKAVA